MRRSYRKTSHERKTKPFHICQAISVARLVSKPEQHPVVSNKVHPFWRGCQGSTISNGRQRNHSQPLLWGPHPDVVEFWVYCSLRGQVSLGIARIVATIACEWFLDPWGLSHKHRTELKFDFESLGTAENLKNSSLRSVCALILSEPCQQFYCTNGLDCVLNVNGNGFSEKVQRCSYLQLNFKNSPWESQVFFGGDTASDFSQDHIAFSRNYKTAPVVCGQDRLEDQFPQAATSQRQSAKHLSLLAYVGIVSKHYKHLYTLWLPTSGVQSCRVEPTFPQ